MIPAFVSAMRDRALRDCNAREVYVWLYERLDVLDFRPVKQSAIEIDVGLKDYTVSRAISLLRDLGYIARGPRDGQVWTYRLVHSRPLLPPTRK